MREDDQPTATITVAYRLDRALGWLVPVEMREMYSYRSLTLTASAQYRNLRQFRVSTKIVERERE